MVNLIQKAAPFILTPRVQAGIAASCVLVGMTVHGVSGWNFVLYATLAGISISWIQLPDLKVSLLLTLFGLSILAMPIFAALWGDQRSGVNFIFLFATMPGLLLILVPGLVAKRAITLCLTWGALVFALSLIIDGLVGDETLLRFSGISHTTNNVSGLLILAIAYSCWKTNKYTFFVLTIFLLGQFLTGSRLGIGLSSVIVIVAMLHSIHRKTFIAAALMSIILYVTLFPVPASSLLTRSELSFSITQAIDRSSYVSTQDLEWYLPSGVLSRTDNDTHFTFLRILQEAGIIAAASYVALLVLAWKRASDPARIAVLLLVISMSMDLYYWIPPNTVGFFWLFLATTLKGESYESTDNTLERVTGDGPRAGDTSVFGYRSNSSSGWAI